MKKATTTAKKGVHNAKNKRIVFIAARKLILVTHRKTRQDKNNDMITNICTDMNKAQFSAVARASAYTRA